MSGVEDLVHHRSQTACFVALRRLRKSCDLEGWAGCGILREAKRESEECSNARVVDAIWTWMHETLCSCALEDQTTGNALKRSLEEALAQSRCRLSYEKRSRSQ